MSNNTPTAQRTKRSRLVFTVSLLSCADGQQQYPSESRPRRHCQCAQTLQSHRIHLKMPQANGMTHMTPAFSGNGYPTSSSETFELGMGGIAGAAGGSSPQAVMNSRAFSAAACSAAFLARAIAVKDVSSYPPCGVAIAGIVRWHVNLGLAGGGQPSSITKTGVPPCTCGVSNQPDS